MYTIAVSDKELSYIVMALGIHKAKANNEGNITLGHEISEVMANIRAQVRPEVTANG